MQRSSAVFCLHGSSSVWLLSRARPSTVRSVCVFRSMCFPSLSSALLRRESTFELTSWTKQQNLTALTHTLYFWPHTHTQTKKKQQHRKQNSEAWLKHPFASLSWFLTSLERVLFASCRLGYVWIWKAVLWRGKLCGTRGSAEATHLGTDDLGLYPFSGSGSLHHTPLHLRSETIPKGKGSFSSSLMIWHQEEKPTMKTPDSWSRSFWQHQ